MPHKDPEKRKAFYAAWKLANREQQRAYFKAYDAARAGRKRPPYKGQKASTKKWRANNAPRVLLWLRGKFAKRRALIRATQVESVDYGLILRDAKGRCGICHEPFDRFGIEFDHIIPIAKGGTHTRANIQATHTRCNRAKGAKVG